MDTQTDQPRRLLTFDLLQRHYGIPYSRFQLLRVINEGKFPRPIRLSDRKNGRRAWFVDEIEDWIATKDEERRVTPEP